MAIKFISVKCPECGASLDAEEGRKQIFCSYCGTKVLIENDNEYVYRHIDEAEIKQAETDRIVQLKKMEIIEKRRAAAEKSKKFKVTLTIILAVVGIIFMLLGYVGSTIGFLMPGMICFLIMMYMWTNNKEEEDLDLGDKVKVPSSIDGYESKSYAAVEAMFIGAGFTNVKCVPLNDLTMGLLKKPGMVESITVSGRTVTSGGKKFSPDAPVVISYHSHR